MVHFTYGTVLSLVHGHNCKIIKKIYNSYNMTDFAQLQDYYYYYHYTGQPATGGSRS